jgi:hypothetical protein
MLHYKCKGMGNKDFSVFGALSVVDEKGEETRCFFQPAQQAGA